MEFFKQNLEKINDIEEIAILIKMLKRKKKSLETPIYDSDKPLDKIKQLKEVQKEEKPKEEKPKEDGSNILEDTRIKKIVFLKREMDFILIACIRGNEKKSGVISVTLDNFRKLVNNISKANIDETIEFMKYENYDKIAKCNKKGIWDIKD